MPPPRKNIPRRRHPSRVSTDPVRTQELLGQFHRKFDLVCQAYRFWGRVGISSQAINQARAKLRAAVAGGDKNESLASVHPLVTLSLNIRATEIAKNRGNALKGRPF